MKRVDFKSVAQTLIETYLEAYNTRNLELLLSIFTKDATIWGTGADEYRVGHKEIEQQCLRDWKQSDSAEVTVSSILPNAHDAPWIALIATAKVTIEGVCHTLSDLRATSVLEQEDGEWKICHMHGSFPDHRNPEEGSFPIDNSGK